MSLSRTAATAVAVGCMGFALTALTGDLLDDHFGRITLGYHWWTFGEAPFRDYVDPGLFGAAAWSAAAFAATGGSLLGEVIFDAAAIGAGLGITCALASRAARSTAAGVAAAAIALAASPRLYDYDKVLSYPAGLWACWHYADRPSWRRAAVAGFVIGVSALLRYDTGIYLGSAWAVTLMAVHRRPSRPLLRDAAISFAVAAGLLAPLVVWLLSIGGLNDAIDAIVTYADIERRRSELFAWTALVGSDGRRVAWSNIMRRGTVGGCIYLGAALLGPVAVAVAIARRRRFETVANAIRLPHVAAAATLCALLVVFVLRDPLAARFGGVLPVVCVLASSLALQRGHLAARAANILGMGVLAGAVVYAGEFNQRREYHRIASAPGLYLETILARGPMLRSSPPSLGLMPGGDRMRSLAWYLRQCTPPDEPVMVTGFAPQTYYFAQRPFAGGIWAFFGDHWRSEARQRQMIARLGRRPPSLIIINREGEELENGYALVAEYVRREYRGGGSTDFDRPDRNGRFQVLVRADSRWMSLDPIWRLPCDRMTTASPGTPP